MQVPMSIFSCYSIIIPYLELSTLDNSTNRPSIYVYIFDFVLGAIFITVLHPWKPKHEFLAKETDQCQSRHTANGRILRVTTIGTVNSGIGPEILKSSRYTVRRKKQMMCLGPG